MTQNRGRFCSQEGENDEDFISSDATILTAFEQKVNQFSIRIFFDTFDESILHHKVCSFSFSELLTWVKERVVRTWKAWRTKEADWGPSPSPSAPNEPHQATTSLWPKELKLKSNMISKLDLDSEHGQLVTVTTASNVLGLGRLSTSWMESL